jgi:hypothetical protein
MIAEYSNLDATGHWADGTTNVIEYMDVVSLIISHVFRVACKTTYLKWNAKWDKKETYDYMKYLEKLSDLFFQSYICSFIL